MLNAATKTSNRIMNFRCNPPLLRHTHNSDHTGVRRRRTHFLQDTQKRSPATRFKQLGPLRKAVIAADLAKGEAG